MGFKTHFHEWFVKIIILFVKINILSIAHRQKILPIMAILHIIVAFKQSFKFKVLYRNFKDILPSH